MTPDNSNISQHVSSMKYRVHVITQSGTQKPRVCELDSNRSIFRISPEQKPGGAVPNGKELSLNHLQRMERHPDKTSFLRLYFSKPSPVSCDLIFRDVESVRQFSKRVLQINPAVHDVVSSSESSPHNGMVSPKVKPFATPTNHSKSSSGMSNFSLNSTEMSTPGPGSLSSLAHVGISETVDSKIRNKWETHIRKFGFKRSSALKDMVRLGIPHDLRIEAWSALAGIDELEQTAGPGYYRTLLKKSNEPMFMKVNAEIDETLRIGDNIEDEGVAAIRRILRAYSVRNQRIGFHPHTVFMAAVTVPIVGEQKAFWLIVHIIEDICGVPTGKSVHPMSYYHEADNVGVKIDQGVFVDLLKEKTPKVHKKLQQLNIAVAPLTLTWFTGLLVNTLPLEAVWRIWDCLFCEGTKVLFRAALALFKHNEKAIIAASTPAEFTNALATFAQTPLNVNEFINLMFAYWIGSLSMSRIQGLRDKHASSIVDDTYQHDVISAPSLSQPSSSVVSSPVLSTASPRTIASPTNFNLSSPSRRLTINTTGQPFSPDHSTAPSNSGRFSVYSRPKSNTIYRPNAAKRGYKQKQPYLDPLYTASQVLASAITEIEQSLAPPDLPQIAKGTYIYPMDDEYGPEEDFSEYSPDENDCLSSDDEGYAPHVIPEDIVKATVRFSMDNEAVSQYLRNREKERKERKERKEKEEKERRERKEAEERERRERKERKSRERLSQDVVVITTPAHITPINVITEDEETTSITVPTPQASTSEDKTENTEDTQVEENVDVQTQVETKPEPEVEVEIEVEVKPEPQPEPEVQSQPEPEPEPETVSSEEETKVEVKVEDTQVPTTLPPFIPLTVNISDDESPLPSTTYVPKEYIEPQRLQVDDEADDDADDDEAETAPGPIAPLVPIGATAVNADEEEAQSDDDDDGEDDIVDVAIADRVLKETVTTEHESDEESEFETDDENDNEEEEEETKDTTEKTDDKPEETASASVKPAFIGFQKPKVIPQRSVNLKPGVSLTEPSEDSKNNGRAVFAAAIKRQAMLRRTQNDESPVAAPMVAKPAEEANEGVVQNAVFWPGATTTTNDVPKNPLLSTSTSPTSASATASGNENNLTTNALLSSFQHMLVAKHTCTVCQLDITENPVYLMGNVMHDSCFKCNGTCGHSLNGQKVYRFNGKYYCTDDYLVMLGRVCVACNKGVVEGLSLSGGKCIHYNCVKCKCCEAKPDDAELYRLANSHTNSHAHDGTFHYVVDDHTFMCHTHYKETVKQHVCAKCNNTVTGDALLVNGNTYHNRCLSCSICNLHIQQAVTHPLSIVFSQMIDGSFYCGKHAERVSQCCSVCAEPLAIAANNNIMHNFCLEFAPDGETPDDELPLPPTDDDAPPPPGSSAPKAPAPSPSSAAPKAPAPKPPVRELCAGCKAAIGPMQTKIKVLGKTYHDGCLKCNECKVTISEVFEHEGKVLCKQHYSNATASKCSACGKPATGKIQGLKGGKTGQMKFHPECLKCLFCNTQIKPGNFGRIPADMYKLAVDTYIGKGNTITGPIWEGMYNGKNNGFEPDEEKLACKTCMESL